ncbi:DUF1735 domain-containing protein [Solitalea lacus]|uniref:DUF1735 domain-containing protein n=1 Tax=Solitalea lacus TaxID=2911172 RepID=UPI001EDA1A19|nr:DUF1735 domain-containing protein [Solitalea lacus]UKJ07414.1 DUF1735 domain-containing protein [Solitalea lacus]
MKKKILSFLLCAGIVSPALFTSCVKDEITELTDQGQSMVKVSESPANKLFFSPFTTVKKVDLFNIMRDVNSNATLNTSGTIKLTLAPDMIANYNKKYKETFVALPESMFTLANSSVVKVDGGYTVTFNPGDFAQAISINVDGGKWGALTNKYAVGFRITNSAGMRIPEGRDSVVALLSIKNQYDGVYKVNGKALREGDPVLSGAFPEQSYSLITTGPNSVKMDRVACWASGANIGGIGPWELTLDPATNNVTVKDAANAAVVNNPAGVNKYDPATKTFSISVYWGTGPANRAWEATFKYDKSR